MQVKRDNLGSIYKKKVLVTNKCDNSSLRFTSAKSLEKVVVKSVLSPQDEVILSRFKQKYNYKAQKQLQWGIKRGMDYVGATLGVIASSPIMLAEAVAIKLESKGPVIFKQVRYGQDGKPFIIYKFRTMYMPEVKDNRALQYLSNQKITKVGRILRKLSLDELPQFFNILKGDMSLVGPRPTSTNLVAADSRHIRRYAVKPGLSLKYPSTKSEELCNKLEIEKDYLENWSLKKDFEVLASIIKRVATGKNA